MAFRDNYIIILLLVTVLVLFAAVWVGLFCPSASPFRSKRFPRRRAKFRPATSDHRVDVQAEDELGLLVTLFNDMAAQLQGTTRELEARRRYMEIILESIPTGVISVDPDLRVNKVNRAARTMFSVGERLDAWIRSSGRTSDAIRDIARRHRKQLPLRGRSNSIRTGRPAHSAVTATRLTAGGFVLVIEDLTEVVRAQKASAWREVARRLAHEIKNPLTPIQLSAERIARNIARLPAAPPRVTTVIEECVQSDRRRSLEPEESGG